MTLSSREWGPRPLFPFQKGPRWAPLALATVLTPLELDRSCLTRESIGNVSSAMSSFTRCNSSSEWQNRHPVISCIPISSHKTSLLFTTSLYISPFFELINGLRPQQKNQSHSIQEPVRLFSPSGIHNLSGNYHCWTGNTSDLLLSKVSPSVRYYF